MFCLGIALGYAGNLPIPEQSVLLMVAGITLALAALVVLAILHKDSWDHVLEVLALDVGVTAFITSKTLSAFWVLVFLSLAVILSIADPFLSRTAAPVGTRMGNRIRVPLRAELLVAGLVIGTFGLVLSLWQGFPFPGIGYSLLDVGLGAVVVFVLIDTLLLRERRRLQEKEDELWSAVRDKVDKLVASELTSITHAIFGATGLHPWGFQRPASESEMTKERKGSALQELSRFLDDEELLPRRMKSSHLNPFDWDYGKFFAEKADALGSLQVRYWSRFLEQDLVSFLIDLEQELRKLDLHLAIVRSDKDELKKMKKPEKAGALAIFAWDKGVVYDCLQEILRLLSYGIQEDLIRL
jgi:hypothetical protein